ncbi:MAG: BlaI/MecI/CopY family transcriptional regulator [Clostridia bacterium]|nr:BlaI/MecI/CopY family transcriptional regulator [Clostridia bacterium]
MEERILREKIAEMLDKAETVDYTKQLPDTEYDVMCAIWAGELPITTGYLMQVLGNDRNWKTPTLISFLQRLEERGFIASFKRGRERCYFPLADQKRYLEAVTKRFMEKYHGGSFISMMDAVFPARTLTDDDIDALLAWLRAGK